MPLARGCGLASRARDRGCQATQPRRNRIGRAGRKRRCRGSVDTAYVKRHDPTDAGDRTGPDRTGPDWIVCMNTIKKLTVRSNIAHGEATPAYVTERKQNLLLSATSWVVVKRSLAADDHSLLSGHVT